MKSICKQCSQKEVGCAKPCADRRIEIAERKERRARIVGAITGAVIEPKEGKTWK